MLGTDVNPGIIPRTVNGIFHSIRSNRWKQPDGQQWEFKISFSYLEIYQEKVSVFRQLRCKILVFIRVATFPR